MWNDPGKTTMAEDEGDFDALLSAFVRSPDAPRPEWAFDPNRSIDEQLNETPFFMSKLPENAAENVKLQALQALLYDGTPEEVATNFKQQGNEAFKIGNKEGYKDALTFYTKGIDQNPSDALLLAQLYGNRAAVHLAMKNFGFAVKDAAVSLSKDQNNVKTFWRAAKASISLGKETEAEAFCLRGLEKFPENADLLALRSEIEAESVRLASERFRLQAGKAEASKLKNAMKLRGVQHQLDAEKVTLLELGPGIFGSDTPRASVNELGHLILPLIFMYPPVGQFDLVREASEDTCLFDHLNEMFSEPAPWDPQLLYASPSDFLAYILPVHGSEEITDKCIYRVDLRTPFSRLLGSVVKSFELGIMAFYIVPSKEKLKFEHKFADYRFSNI
jgi:hypothetical protein